MRTVYRYPLLVTDVQTITGPGLSRVIAVDNRRGELEAWAEVDDAQPVDSRRVYVVGTGNPRMHDSDADYIGHVIDGPFVWHVYAEARR